MSARQSHGYPASCFHVAASRVQIWQRIIRLLSPQNKKSSFSRLPLMFYTNLIKKMCDIGKNLIKIIGHPYIDLQLKQRLFSRKLTCMKDSFQSFAKNEIFPQM